MKKLLFGILSFSLLFTACAPNADKGSESGDEAIEGSKACVYSYNADSTSMTWTGYKFNERVGVSGTFTEIITDGFKESDDIAEVVGNASFKIPVNKVESNNEDRNKKIAVYFFETINTPVIFGRINGLNYNGENGGNAEVIIAMNNQEVMVSMPYTFENGVLNMSTTIDVNDWNGQMGINQLNEMCYDLHKGADGVSKLWPEVKIEVNAVFDRVCE